MSWSFISIDRTALPQELLPLVKSHCRVDFADDDNLITMHIAIAISYCEKFWGLQIFGSEVSWSPALSTGASRYQCPLQPVSDFTISSDSTDVKADYRLESGTLIEPVWLVRADGTAFHPDAVITLAAGHAAVAEIDPAATGGILRMAATLYEHRESISSYPLDQVPYWLNDMMGGLWVPRA
jgi:hypothetical protein